MSVLREMGLQNVRTRRHATTFEEAVDTMNDDFMRLYELMGIPIREVLAGHAWVREFSDSSQLEVMIYQIELFFDHECENWARTKRRYRRIERQFARTLLVAIRMIRKNLFWSLLVKPPVDRITYLRLMVCYRFRPFHTHWTTKQCRTLKRKIVVIRYYYEHFNQASQEDLHRLINRNDKLLVKKLKFLKYCLCVLSFNIKNGQSEVSILGPLGYEPSTLPLRHPACRHLKCQFLKVFKVRKIHLS